jgi:serine phosphatase RsbU (regulator of sigma subunit)/anti-sigma regulatory factor (Ser/Thr protein kinase)
MRTAATRDPERLTLLVRAGEIFHQSLDVVETLNNVARLAVEDFADLCIFDLLDERSDRLFVTAAAHRDPRKEAILADVGTLLYVEEYGVHPVVRVTRTGQPFFLPHIDEQTIRQHAASRQHETYMRRLGYRSKIVVPVIAHDRIFGALTFVRTKDGNEFQDRDLFFAIELGRRAGLAVANAKQFHREQYVAETLQRSLLPRRFPSRPGLELSAFYRPGSTEADIGGDWYDAFENSGGEIIVSIGDVTGKGVDAARVMALMRQAIRVAALDFGDPRRIADICNRLLLSEDDDRLASAFIGVIDPDTRVLRYVSAGHAPPLLRLPNKEVHTLHAPSVPLGAFWSVDFELHEQPCPENSVLVLYTDGVLEASRDVVAGEKMLEAVLSSDAVLHTANAAEFIERAIANQRPRDDIAILVVNFGHSAQRWQFEADDARSAYAMRDQFFASLRGLCDPDEAQLATCGVIFCELIGNAVRHAPGPLSVSLEQRDGALVLHVIDKGPGFAYRPHLPSNIWSESGRGLYLISKLARAVEVERIPGLGSHVSVTLPVTCASREELLPVASLSPSATLVRDDRSRFGAPRPLRSPRTTPTATY